MLIWWLSRYDGGLCLCNQDWFWIIKYKRPVISVNNKSPFLYHHRIVASFTTCIELKMTTLRVSSGEEIIQLKGQLVDTHTRCRHYHSILDIIAIKFKCCGTYFPCYKCHQELESHDIIRWKKLDLDSEKVILCGLCCNLLYYQEYSANDNKCLYCNSSFNPNCSLHYGLYFEMWLQFAYYFIMLQYGEKRSYCT